ncbi:MAG: HNH endonuclease [Caldilineaceae bacterium]|nr:HNH endonuclease [Caldilineaceae bacterium]
MSHTYIPKPLREQVRSEARNRCGYCQTQQDIVGIQLHIEHLLPEAAGGMTVLANLWLACSECNNHKGAQIDAIDPVSAERVSLFNPRFQQWGEHFRWSEDGTQIIGISPTGRATVIALDLNQPFMLIARRRWVLVGWHPPRD